MFFLPLPPLAYRRVMALLLAAVIVFTMQMTAVAQTVKPMPDGRATSVGKSFQQLMAVKPKEVLFGIELHEDGTVWFSMSNIAWFHKIFTGPQDGITVDIVSKDRYNCNSDAALKTALPHGVYIKPMYLADLKKNMVDLGAGHLTIQIGQVPAALRKKETEGNLVIIKNGVIGFYTNFTDIDRSLWDLLPMGLYADTLLQSSYISDSAGPIFYSRQIQVTIPFAKNKAEYSASGLSALKDSLQLKGYHITRMDIRAYSSVEGTVQANEALQKKRAAAVIKGLQQLQITKIQSNITASENWVEFYSDVTDTPFDELSYLSRPEVKKKLLNPKLLTRIEPILSKHRKAVVTAYVDRNSGNENLPDTALYRQFNTAVVAKDIPVAVRLQREIFTRIAEARLPVTYMSKLEIPREKACLYLLSNHEAYRYQLGITEITEAINAFKELLLLDTTNAKVRYNVCALTMQVWKNDTGFINPRQLLADINALGKFGIEKKLVIRMLVNYNILLSELYMSRVDYAAKDRAVDAVIKQYVILQLNDKELLSLAKYLCAYARFDQAQSMLQNRASQIDVSEDLLFYYLNLQLFQPNVFESGEFETVVLNAVSINRKRFCKLFSSLNKGGVSFQLLEYDILNDMYCEYCAP